MDLIGALGVLSTLHLLQGRLCTAAVTWPDSSIVATAGSRFGDLCTWLWCGPCALCQVRPSGLSNSSPCMRGWLLGFFLQGPVRQCWPKAHRIMSACCTCCTGSVAAWQRSARPLPPSQVYLSFVALLHGIEEAELSSGSPGPAPICCGLQGLLSEHDVSVPWSA